MSKFEFGRAGVNRVSGNRCCGNPHGCSIVAEDSGCLYLKHPWKRYARGEISGAECYLLMNPDVKEATDDA